MDNRIFVPRPLIRQSLAQRIFRQQPEENAIIEVNNLLATREISTITHTDLAEIDRRYGFRVRSLFSLNLEEFYAVYLHHCLRDRLLDSQELDELQHLKELFGISDKTIAFLHEQIGGETYRKTFEEAVADGELSKEEKHFLQALSHTVRLSESFTEKISTEVRSGLLREKLVLAAKDNRLSPEEEQELLAISKNLGVSIAGVTSRKQLERMKFYWALENLEMPLLTPGISLPKEETCHCISESVQWKKISGKNWSALLEQQSIFSGDEIPVATAYNGRYLEPVDKGSLYITNRRIIFEGREKRNSIRLDKILRVKTYTDALEIIRESGKNPIFLIKEPEEAGILLERLVRN